jgi:hypothetical protein
MSTNNNSTPTPNNSTNNSGIAGKVDKIEDKAPVEQKQYGDFLGMYKGISETTGNVVKHAAEVMESEIATVVKVARHLEQNSPIGEKLRSEKPDELVQRFRRDAHEVVDIWIDVFGVALKSMSETANTLVMKNAVYVKQPVTVGAPATVAPQQSVKAGELAQFPISFENSSDIQTEEFKLFSTELIGDSGDRISSGLIKFMPASLKLAPNQTEKVNVIIAVPKETKPGIYTGLVLAANMNQLRSEIMIKVE